MTTKIFDFRAAPPIEAGGIARQHLRVAHGYQNDQIAGERQLRADEDRIVNEACPPGVVAVAARATWWVERWCALARQMRADGRSPKRGESPIAKRIERARQRERETSRALWAAQKAARKLPSVRAAISGAIADKMARHKHLRATSGTPGMWGTRGLVDQSVEAAVESTRKRRFGLDKKGPADPSAQPRFQRDDGGGRVGVQIIGGLSVADALACAGTQLRIQILDEPAAPRVAKNGRTLPQRQPGSRRSATGKHPEVRALVWLRVESDEKRAPVWAKIPIRMTRPLPPDAIVMRAWLLVRPVGPRLDYRLQFTLQIPDEPARSMPAAPRTLAVNVGWRQLRDGGLRVAYAVGSDGREEEIRVQPEVGAAIEHADSIRAIRDRAMETMVAQLRAFGATSAAPESFKRAVRMADQWEASERLMGLLGRWGGTPVGAEGVLVEALAAWARQDRHLHFWEADEQAKALRRRQDCRAVGYRAVAQRWTREYDRIVVTNMDLSEMARQPDAEEGARGEGRNQRRNRMLAAPSVLMSAILLAFGKARIDKPDAKFATRVCPSCGVVAEDTAPFRLSERVVCEACGEERDQDVTHGRELLRRAASAQVVNGPAKALAESEKQGAVVGGKVAGGRFVQRRSRKVAQVGAATTE